MKQGYIAAIGVACIDEYCWADQWIPEGEKGIIRWGEAKVGGMIPNAAVVCAGLGLKTYLVTALNSGPVSQTIRKDLEHWGLDLHYAITDETLPDSRCIIVCTEGARTILVPDNSTIRYPVSQELRTLLSGAACIYTSMMEFKRLEAWESLAEELRQAGVKLVFDLEPSTFDGPDELLFRYGSCLLFNKEGMDHYARGRDMDACMDGLLAQGAGVVAVTLGAEGCCCKDASGMVRIPGNRVPVVDPTGAGDTFNCAFISCLMEGKPLSYAAEFANAAAAHAVTVLGARGGVAPKEEIEGWMRTYAQQRKEGII